MRKPIALLLILAGALVVCTVFAATAVAAPAGYRVVKGASLPAPPGQFDSGSQTLCPTGTVPWGGGAAGNAFTNMNINTSEPNTSGWEARVNNPDSPGGTFEIDAICAKKPKGYTFAFSTVDNPPGARSVATATCPVNTVVLSGGVLSTSDEVGARMLGAWPTSKTSFRAVELNATSSDARLTAEALCAAKPAGYTIVRSTLTENPMTLDLGGESCPAGKSVIGGGVRITGGDATALVHTSIENGTTGWANDITTGSVPLTLLFSAICVS